MTEAQRAIRFQLMELAEEMQRGEGLPAEFAGDGKRPLPPLAELQAMDKVSLAARLTAQRWSKRIMQIVDAMAGWPA